jgi:general secretion pathway protein J
MSLRRQDPDFRARGGRAGGFTLLELVIALTLLGLILVVLFSALRLGGRIWERLDGEGERAASLNAAQVFLRRTLGQARVVTRTTELKLVSLFAGEAGRMDFVAPLSTYVGAPGLHLLRLQVAGSGDNQRLMLTRWLLHPEVLGGAGGVPRWSPEEIDAAPVSGPTGEIESGGGESATFGRAELLAGLDGVRFSYFGQKVADTEPQWHEDWMDQEALPLLVRVQLGFPGHRWPDLVFALAGG